MAKIKKATKKPVKKPVKKVVRKAKPKASKKPKKVLKAKTNSEGKLIGRITHYFSNIEVAVIDLISPLKVGDTIRVIGGQETDFEQAVSSMQIEHEEVKSGKKGDSVGMKVNERFTKAIRFIKYRVLNNNQKMADNIQQEIEDKVIDCINSGVAGRLIIFRPEKNSLGADLAVEKRGEYKGKEIYFQISSFVGPAKEGNFIKDFPQEYFKDAQNFYLLFVYFNEVTQKIKDYIWLIPSLQFRNIAEVIKSPEGNNFLHFEAPLDVKVKSKYSKFVVGTKGLGKMILEAIEKGGKFDFKEAGTEGLSEEKSKINLDNLKDFLAEARRNTYASNNTPTDNPRLLESTQLEFQKGDYFYRDIYFSGSKNFIGQEIVYQESKPVWGMNYIGNAIGKLETIFLKESLFKLSEKCRFGGVCEYERRELKYQDQGQGSLEGFSGEEKIYLEAKNIYKLSYHGGIISDKL